MWPFADARIKLVFPDNKGNKFIFVSREELLYDNIHLKIMNGKKT